MARLTLEQAKQNMGEHSDALHFVNHPAHASAVLREVHASLGSLVAAQSDDPVIFAYQLRDLLPKWGGSLKLIKWWSDAVIDATPDQVPDHGAKLCLIEN